MFGISEDLYEESIAEGPMISVHVDTFLAFKAKEDVYKRQSVVR